MRCAKEFQFYKENFDYPAGPQSKILAAQLFGQPASQQHVMDSVS